MMLAPSRLKVIQWTTGNVGRRAVRAIATDPRLELVGCYAYSPGKVGIDAGVLAGLEPLGILATDDIDALLAARPDCVCYSPMHFDDDHVCRLLQAGVNVATTAEFITGQYLGAERRGRLERAALSGGATLFGSGLNPGHANLFALVSAGICQRVDRVRVTESVDCSGYESAETQQSIGFGWPIDDPDLHERAKRATAVFADAVAVMGDALGAEFDDIVFDAEFAVATDDADLGFMTIPKGTVSAVRAGWSGLRAGQPLVECRVLWVMGPYREPAWKVDHGYFIEIDGLPAVRSRFQVLPPRDWSEPNYMGLGMIMTAMPVVNAIPAVCAAPPGISTIATLPLVTHEQATLAGTRAEAPR
jgi:4-hydroxy-tetrahydrodipicolinate reductase